MKWILYALAFFSTLLIVGCAAESVPSSESTSIATTVTDDVELTSVDAKELLDTKCMICHKLAPTHDELLAPPMRGVQMNYRKKFPEKENFVEAVVNWVSNPDSAHSVMTGAIDQFGVMPNLGYSEEDIRVIANYMYDADFPRPAWAGKGRHGKR